MKRAFLIWVVGLFTLVPYALWYLLFEAERSHYPFLITFIFAWVTGYYSVVLPMIAAWRVRKFFRFIQSASSADEIRKKFATPENREAFIVSIARENGVPLFLARRIFARIERGLLKEKAEYGS
ncbi:hypothetical protein [Pelagibacterium halotolerans]|uniref:hypothetical protein n=1 Tax=Pelagibacterium halotolerans TaxID=531813 RepID=UPI00384C71CC